MEDAVDKHGTDKRMKTRIADDLLLQTAPAQHQGSLISIPGKSL